MKKILDRALEIKAGIDTIEFIESCIIKKVSKTRATDDVRERLYNILNKNGYIENLTTLYKLSEDDDTDTWIDNITNALYLIKRYNKQHHTKDFYGE